MLEFGGEAGLELGELLEGQGGEGHGLLGCWLRHVWCALSRVVLAGWHLSCWRGWSRWIRKWQSFW